jgi:hypothetical protein
MAALSAKSRLTPVHGYVQRYQVPLFRTKTDSLATFKFRGFLGSTSYNEEFCNLLLFTKCYSDDQLKEDEVGVACGTSAGKKCIQGFRGDTCRQETALKN